MARFMRTDLGPHHSHLEPPVVVGEGVVFPPVQGYLFPISDVQTRVRKGTKSELRPPTVVTSAAAFVASPIRVYGADEADQVRHRSSQRATHSRLRPPIVVRATPLAPPVKTYGADETDQVRHRSVQRRTMAGVRAPQFVGAGITFAPVSVKLAYSRRGRAKSLLPKVIAGPVVAVARPVQTHLAPSRRGRTMAGVRPPQFVGASVTFPPVAVHLAYSRRGTAKPRLRPPAVVASQQAFYLNVNLAPRSSVWRRNNQRSVQWKLFPPARIDLSPQVKYVSVNLAYSRRGQPKSDLRAPTVVGVAAAGYPVAVHLARTDRRFIRTRSTYVYPIVVFQTQALGWTAIQFVRRPNPSTRSRLFPPAVITAVAQVYYGPRVELARQSRRPSHSFLRPPVIPPLARPVDVTLARIRPVAVDSRLKPPTVIDLRPQTYYLAVHLTRIRPKPTTRFLRPPVDTVGIEDQGRVAVHLAYSRRGVPKSRLEPPTVIDFRVYGGPSVTLAYQSRGKAKPRLTPPTVIDNRPQTVYLSVTLAYSKRGVPKPRLFPPAAISRDTFFGPTVTLAYSRRGRARAGLAAPAVVFIAEPVLYPVAVSLAYSVRGKPRSALGRPSVVGAVVYFGPSVALAYSRRGAPKSGLRKPVAIDVRPQTVYLSVTLAPSKRGLPKSSLKPPTVVTRVAFYGPAVSLSYSVRGRTIAGIRPPRFVGAGVVFAPVQVHLARIRPQPTHPRLSPPPTIQATPKAELDLRVYLTYSRRGTPKSRLEPPTVVGTPTPVLYPIQTTLVRLSLRGRGALSDLPVVVYAPVAEMGGILVSLAPQRRGVPKSLLGKPTVVAAVVYSGPAVNLTYSRRGVPKSVLRKPTVIDLRPQVYYLSVTLVRITPPPVMSRLSPSAVTEALPRAERDLRVYLAYSVRGKPKSVLRKPVVIDVRPQTRFVSVNLAYSVSKRGRAALRPPAVVARFVATPVAVSLAYSLRGTPKSRLEPPVVVSQFVARPTRVELAYSRRGRPVYELKPPTVVAPVLARPTKIALAYQSRRPGRVELRPPTVVRIVAFYGPATTLVRIVPPKTRARLRPPTAVFPFRARPITVTLVRIRPPARFWLLTPPTVIEGAVLYPISVTLAPQSRGKAKYGLAAPAVVSIAEPVLYPIRVTLVRIRPPKRFWKLFPPAVVTTFVPPAGDVCDFTSTDTEVCDDTTTDTEVCDDTDTGSNVIGSDTSESRIVGGDSTVGEVCDTNEKAT